MKKFTIVLVILIALATAAIGGGEVVLSSIGDWLIIRKDGQCAAIDPNDGGRIVGTWPISDDKRCHMSRFIWNKLLE
jgi:hypothetical protein